MSRSLRGLSYRAVVGVTCLAAWARAELVLRSSVEQRGDAVLIGNTLAQNCSDEVPVPLVGSVGACGADADDSGADVLWSVGAAGQQPVANNSVDPAEAASIAVLALPAGAIVTHARLYWSAAVGGGNRTRASLSRVTGDALAVDGALGPLVEEDGNTFYQASADVTAFVQAGGAGAYRVSGIDVADPVGSDDTSHYAAWWLVVFYSLETEPVRHLGLYDGLERLADSSTSVTLTGFEVAPGSVDARLGVVGYEGDGTLDGDHLRVGAAAPLGANDAVGRADNFFDGSRRGPSGEAVAVAGDLPETSGAPDSLSGFDLHVVDVAAAFAPGQTSAQVEASTEGDHFFLGGLVLSVVAAAPELGASTERVRDLDGPPLRPGDELEYTIEVNNSGTGAAPSVSVRAPLPAGVAYVPGSLALGVDPGAIALTDAADGDAGELEARTGDAGAAAAGVLSVRLGAGDGASGGPLEVGETRVVRYRVVVGADAGGSLVSQAELLATSASGAVTSRALSDSDLMSPGASPTEIIVDGCGTDADCGGGTPRCDLAAAPTRCVGCLSDADCSGLTPVCEPTQTCDCRPSSSVEALCDGRDDDCNGLVDEGLAGGACEVAVGSCRLTGTFVCDLAGAVRCSAPPVGLQPERCSNGMDDDCDGDTDGADADCAESLAGTGSEPLAPGAPEPGAARTPGSSLSPAPGSSSLDPSTEGTGVSLGGGASCHFAAAPASRLGGAWLALGLLAARVRRRARRRAGVAA